MVFAPDDAYFRSLARDHAAAERVRDDGEHGVLLMMASGIRLHLPPLLWGQYQVWRQNHEEESESAVRAAPVSG